jgi:hypothetical protein
MSTQRDVAYLLRSWIRSEPDGPVDHVIDAILAEVDATPQRRSTWWPARRPTMSTIVRLGVVAAVLAVAVAIGYTVTQNVGNEDPIPNPSDQSSAPPDTSPVAGDMISELLGIFIGATRDVPGVEVDDRLVLDTTSRVFRVNTGADQSALLSAMSVAESGLLRLETVADTTECANGDVGTYAYSLSPGGTVLTIASGDDDCAPRAATVIGEWRRSACQDQGNWCLGTLETGAQSSLFFDPYLAEFGSQVTRYGAMTYEVPDGWANADDRTHFYTLLRAEDYVAADPFNCLDCPDGMWIGANPAAASMDCVEEIDETVGTSAQDLAAWLRQHPGLEVTGDFANQGPPGSGFVSKITLDIVASDSYADACQDPEFDVTYVPLFAHPGYVYGIRTGDRHRLILVEIDSDSAMLIGIDPFDPDGLESLVEDAQPIVDSIRLAAP